MNRLGACFLVLGLALSMTYTQAGLAVAQEEEPSGIGATAADDAEVAPDGTLEEAEGLAALEEEGEGQRTFGELFGYGGWVMYVLVAQSAIVLALIVERLIALRTNAVIPRKFMRNLMEPWRRGDIAQVTKLCANSRVSIARVLRAGLMHFDEGMARVEDAVDSAGNHEATLLRRNLNLISAMGNIATMVGLLGTVLGMITAFDIIAKTGTGDASMVAGGIFQALITTAAGLIVGITAVGAHSFLRRRVEVLEINLEETSFRLIEELNRPAVDRAENRPARDSASFAPAGA